MSERVLNNNDEVMATQPVVYSNEELVTVADFPDPATAHVASSALEAANIPVFLQGENANNMIPVAFGVRLQVRSQDEAAARAILADFEATPETLEDVTAAEQAEERERS
jgi:Putative prokaryotic signal transducing protein